MPQFTGTDVVCFRGERTVFHGLTFGLGAGEAVMLRGANGSGKSSLLRLMAGLGRPLSGVIGWQGQSIANDPEAHNARLHYIGHHDPVKPVLTVAENLGFWAALRSQGENGKAVEAALGRLGIGHLATVPGRFLSAGQKRRVNLARALTTSADLWLLDEPQTALDKAAEHSFLDAIAEHRSKGGMVVMSSHAEESLADATELDLGKYQVAS
ncbi:MAG: heme ABC exporter ATP-binding protein CcmA [Rhodospirillales bacterium]